MQSPTEIAPLPPSAGATAVASATTIVVTYNNERQIAACLASLREDPATAGGIVVVDNASADATVAIVRERFPEVELVQTGANLGFGRACNVGARRATGDYLAFVNPDTVLDGHAISNLLAFARRRPDGGIWGGRAMRPDGSPGIESVFAQPSLWGNLCFGLGLTTLLPRTVFDPESLGRWQRDSVREVGVVCGLLMLVERDVWDRLGGFDEDFFMYAEDVDLCRRAAKLGYRPSMTPDAVVVHEGGGSSPTTGAGRTLLLAGRVTFVRKHWGPLRSRAGTALLLLGTGIRAALGNEGWREAWRRRAEWLHGYGGGGGRRQDDPLGGMRSRARTALIRALRRRLYRGSRIACPCCGGSFRRLVTHRGAPDVRCPGCGSMERHRLLWLYLRERSDLLSRRRRVLHMAPEDCIQRLLAPLENVEYVAADLASPLADVHCDIQRLPFEDDRFDVVICNHVLEHVPDDRAAMRELARVTAPGGWAVLMCPIGRDRATTLTDPAVRTPADALRVYGQEDHVRLYGADYRERLEAAGFEVTVERFLDELAPEVVERHRLRRRDDVFEADDIYIGRVGGSS
ncbi:MAG TPA: glycosyltransferase [Solirubrobacteraceae bacterium]|jgi:N-acetylglucosaminyl-diphospho-decaprenol L-rhamnosyltransferase|nr:glycosyltransferase [Solirubrobacteraceae bacterium]